MNPIDLIKNYISNGLSPKSMVEKMSGNIVEIVRELSNVDNPQVMNIIKKHANKIMDM